MIALWGHTGPTILSAFLASLVECVEALTVVLAVGTVRGWRGALTGTGLALLLLALLVLILGPALTAIPIEHLQLGIGVLLLLFGMRWLRKAILRAAGVIALHDEEAIYSQQTRVLSAQASYTGVWDKVAMTTAFKITMVEGIEVVFIVLAVGTASRTMLAAAGTGALAALMVVILLGLLLRRPAAMIPENALKFGVGVLLCAFGTFWVGEGMALEWPGGDWSLAGLGLGYLLLALVAVMSCSYLVQPLAGRR
jgi:Ca2+/H+ antiporter, TMEM165/GDT1 family